jgi:TM2 domain-containing membrane protein YozV
MGEILMINALSYLLKNIAGWRSLVLFVLLFIVVTSVLFPTMDRLMDAPEDIKKIDTQFIYSADQFYDTIEPYGDRGRKMYALSHFTADLVFPFSYAFFFGVWITMTYGSIFAPDSWLQHLNLTPFALLMLDLLENMLVSILLLTFPLRLDWLANLAGGVTAIKWLFSGATVALAVGGTLAWIIILAQRRFRSV